MVAVAKSDCGLEKSECLVNYIDWHQYQSMKSSQVLVQSESECERDEKKSSSLVRVNE